jgi:hypothetical protein
VSARGPQPREVLTHDDVQEAPAFNRGRHLGTQVRGASLEGSGTFESEVIQSPFPFTHVGLHWRGNVDQIGLELRTSADGQAWTAWQTLHIEAVAGATPAGDTFASLVYGRRHAFLQYRAGVTSGQSLNRVTATFLNVDDGPSLAVTTTALTKPSFITHTREEWGCNEGLRFDRRGREIWPRMYVPVKKLIVHHTAGRNDYSEAEAPGEVRAVYTYHAKTEGWGDIGYHALVDRFGNCYEGRYSRDLSGGREVCGPDVVAGHAYSHNYGSFGVAVIGEYESAYDVDGDSLPDEQPSSEMLNSLINALAYRAAERGIDPLGTSDFLESDGTWNGALPNISGHLDTSATACPGDLLYALLGSIRQSVKSRMSLGAAPAFSSGPAGGPSSPSMAATELAYAWGPGGGATSGVLYRYYLEGWSKTSNSEAVTYLSGFSPDRYPAWTAWGEARAASFSGLGAGHYTMHIQQSVSGAPGFEASRTVLLTAPAGGKKPPRR